MYFSISAIMKFRVKHRIPLTPRSVMIFSLEWSFQWITADTTEICSHLAKYSFLSPAQSEQKYKIEVFSQNIGEIFLFRAIGPHQTCLEQPLLWCRQPYNSRITTELQRRKLKSTSLIASGGRSQIGSGLNLPNLGPFDRLLCTNGIVLCFIIDGHNFAFSNVICISILSSACLVLFEGHGRKIFGFFCLFFVSGKLGFSTNISIALGKVQTLSNICSN